MAGRAETTLPATRRPRKSTGNSPVRKRIEKENITVDMASSLAGNAGRKKLRSKSIGPGGLDGLKSGAGNRRASLAAPIKPPPRSILKPSISSLPEIPAHRPKSTSRGSKDPPNANDNSGSGGTKVALRTEEEQQAAAREREERERAQEKEKEIADRREARRKSLANRRVSFAAEATLHTFHEIEWMQDNTTSSNSTRRSSTAASRAHEEDDHDSPPGDNEPLTYTHNEDNTIASTVYSSDSEATEGMVDAEEVDSDSGSDSDADGYLDVDEVTGTTVASIASAMSRHSDMTGRSEDTLDRALGLAQDRAVTQSLDDDEEIIPSFGWVKKPAPKAASAPPAHRTEPTLDERGSSPNNEEATMDLGSDMEMTRPVGGIIDFEDTANGEEGDDEDVEMSMDVTKALGGILPGQSAMAGQNNAKGPEWNADDEGGDATMEFTTAVGGINRPARMSDVSDEDLLEFDDNEDMSMELTSVLGKVLPGVKRKSLPGRRRTLQTEHEEMTMDMTTGLGRILDGVETDPEHAEDITMGMDMTMAIGGIIAESPSTNAKAHARQGIEEAANESENSTPKAKPSSGLKNGTLRQNLPAPASSSPMQSSPFRDQPVSPVKKIQQHFHKPSTPTQVSTPPQQAVGQPGSETQPKPPRRTPTSVSRTGRVSPAKKPTPISRIMSPLIVLTPQQRRLSGLGADRAGLGSPKIAALFERRTSLGQAAEAFVPSETLSPKRGVSFADPRAMNEEFDKEIREDQARSNGLEDDNNTATLQDRIFSMTPKKSTNARRDLRKSLHVGSAAGLLGKRPLELDGDDDDDDDLDPMDGVKRLKNHQGSPVKNIRLNAPPSKADWSNSVNSTMTFSPQKKIPLQTSPKGKKFFNFAESDLPTGTLSFDTVHLEEFDEQDENDSEKIHLQDFLNMTSIRFIELTTIKTGTTRPRRSTRNSSIPGKENVSLERRIVAGACTVPMLELYQHSCRELKKYISEGRRIMREIETETLEENPPLFQEYMNATPDFKVVMDNQFKNVKTHARLLSKAMWYEWRTQLQDGLKEGLIRIGEGMNNDEKLLNKEQKLLDSVLPGLQKHFESLESDHRNLKAAAEELADCDPEDLQAARDELENVSEDIEMKLKKIETLKLQLAETEKGISESTTQKAQCLSDIEESEKIRQECRGWTSNEVRALKAKVDDLEKSYGWAITGIAGTTVSMTYLKEIELVFDISLLEGRKSSTQVDLWYIAAARELDPIPATPDREFFLQCIRDYIRLAVQANSRIADLLPVVSESWDKAIQVSQNLRMLNSTFPTHIDRTSDSSVLARSVLLLAPLQTKVEISIELKGRATADGLDVSVSPSAKVLYGEHFKVDKLAEYLSAHLGTTLLSQKEAEDTQPWSNHVVDLGERLLARGRKQG